MPSKITVILAVGGLALDTADPGSGLYEEIEKHRIGILVNAEDTDALLEGIKNALLNDNDDIRSNARNYAVDHLSPGRVFAALPKLLGS